MDSTVKTGTFLDKLSEHEVDLAHKLLGLIMPLYHSLCAELLPGDGCGGLRCKSSSDTLAPVMRRVSRAAFLMAYAEAAAASEEVPSAELGIDAKKIVEMYRKRWARKDAEKREFVDGLRGIFEAIGKKFDEDRPEPN